MPQIYNAVIVKASTKPNKKFLLPAKCSAGRQPGASYFHEVPPMKLRGMEVTGTGAQSVYRLVPPLWVSFFNVLGDP